STGTRSRRTTRPITAHKFAPLSIEPNRPFSRHIHVKQVVPLASPHESPASPKAGFSLWRPNMPEWLKATLALAVLTGFIGYAFWRSRGVKPSKTNRDDWPTLTGGGGL
ncbi:MAG: hypothetical protein K2X57_09990, partial [Xanthobacteraceae bacterium]|nr:hypothetical protein [Xanthobacteraceae bacterium]